MGKIILEVNEGKVMRATGPFTFPEIFKFAAQKGEFSELKVLLQKKGYEQEGDAQKSRYGESASLYTYSQVA